MLSAACWQVLHSATLLSKICPKSDWVVGKPKPLAVNSGSYAEKDGFRGHTSIQNGQVVISWGCNIAALGHMHCAGCQCLASRNEDQGCALGGQLDAALTVAGGGASRADQAAVPACTRSTP